MNELTLFTNKCIFLIIFYFYYIFNLKNFKNKNINKRKFKCWAHKELFH